MDKSSHGQARNRHADDKEKRTKDMDMVSISNLKALENNDLLGSILFPLPPKSVLRLKAVSKHWCKLISSSSFCFHHTIYHLRHNGSIPPNFFLQHEYTTKQSRESLLILHPGTFAVAATADGKHPYLSFSFILDKHPGLTHLCVINASNGLILLSASNSSLFLVCNPLTRDYEILSPLNFSEILLGVNLVCNPLQSEHYKVVAFIDLTLTQDCVKPSGDPYHHYQIQIYSSQSEKWNFSRDWEFYFQDDDGFRVSNIKQGVSWNGALYWPPYPYGKSLFRFDLESLCLQVIPLPPRIPNINARLFHYFGESGEHLYFVEGLIPYCMCTSYNIWELQETQKGCCVWKLKFHFEDSVIPSAIPGQPLYYPWMGTILYLHTNGDGEVQLMICRGDGVSSLNITSADSNNPSSVILEKVNAGEYLNHESDANGCGMDIIPFINTLFPLGQ